MSKACVHLICTARLFPIWQWRWEEGCAQVLATFRAAAEMLRQHDELIFTQGDATLHAMVERYDPPLFREIQHLVADGKWCLSGGWQLEPETRFAGLEALVRNLAHARRYLGERFKSKPRVLVLLETAGAPAGLPQIARQAGYQFLVTRGLPREGEQATLQVVRWLGLDDSELLGLELPPDLHRTDAEGLPGRLQAAVALAAELGKPVPVFWGLSDHEGGGGREDLTRVEEFMATVRGVPILHSSLERLQEEVASGVLGLPALSDDGRGANPGSTCSLARHKRRSRRCLGLLVQAEAAAAAAWLLREAPYPEEQLEDAWNVHLLNDGHRVLSGALIEPASQDATDLSGRVEDIARTVRLAAGLALQRGVSWRVPTPLVIQNSNPALVRAPVEAECQLDHRPRLGGEWHLRVFAPDGTEVPCQEEAPDSLLSGRGWRRKVVFSADLPGVGAAYYKVELTPGSRRPWPAPPALAHAIDPARGLLTSIDAGDGAECLSGALLEPLVFADDGGSWGADADLGGNLVGRFKLAEGPRVLVKGPIRSVTESILKFGQSRISLRVIAYAGWPVLEIRMRVQWNEERRRLKLVVPTALLAPALRVDAHGGWVRQANEGGERAHGRWFLIEGQSGERTVAVGVAHSGEPGLEAVEGSVLISALRSIPHCRAVDQGTDSFDPPLMDQGVHDLRFAVTAGEPETVLCNLPVLADWIDAPPAVFPHLPVKMLPNQDFVEVLGVEPATVRLCAFKRSWDKRSLVVRVQESVGRPTEAVVRLRSPQVEARVALKPFQIKTLRIERDGSWKETDILEGA